MLSKLNIMDYSLLIGIERNQEGQLATPRQRQMTV
jgi:hypothetical protein